jgi:outer membrane receptor protein involved in Fe transport
MAHRPVRLLLLTTAFLFIAHSTAFAQAPPAQSGVVVDAQGAPVLRARVRILDAKGVVLAHALTDQRGRFSAPAATIDCRIEVSLPGFGTASERCAGADVRVVIAPAPISEAVVVSATRDAAPLSQVGSSMSVFTADDIERRGAVLVADLLRAMPGVTVVQSGAPGTQTSMFVRGGESNYNKVLLDGIPINEPGGTFNFGNVTTEHLERIEVVRGAECSDRTQWRA